MNEHVTAILLFVMLLIAACGSPLSDGDAGGSEITNGAVMTADGFPAAGAIVTACRTDHVPGTGSGYTVYQTITSHDGAFSIRTEAAHFNIFISDSEGGYGCTFINTNAGASVGTAYLTRTGMISGSVTLDTAQQNPFLAGCIGTPFSTEVDAADGTFLLRNIPAGVYPVSVYSKFIEVKVCPPDTECNSSSALDEYREMVTVTSGTTATVTMHPVQVQLPDQ